MFLLSSNCSNMYGILTLSKTLQLFAKIRYFYHDTVIFKLSVKETYIVVHNIYSQNPFGFFCGTRQMKKMLRIITFLWIPSHCLLIEHPFVLGCKTRYVGLVSVNKFSIKWQFSDKIVLFKCGQNILFRSRR